MRTTMKRIALILLALYSIAYAQRYNFEGSTTSTADIGAVVEDSSGWQKINSTNIGLKVPTDNVVVGGTAAQSYRLAIRQTAGATAPFALLLDASGTDSTLIVYANGKLSLRGGDVSTASVALAIGSNQFMYSPSGFLVNATASVQDLSTGNGLFWASGKPYISTTTQFGVGTSQTQGFLTTRASGTADTLAIFRNDKNSTLDSTAIIHADGFVEHRHATHAIGDTIGFVLTSGTATLTRSSNIILDTEGAVAADTCLTLTASAVGRIVYVSTRDAARDITFLDAGNFALGAERVLSNPSDVLVLKATSTTTWKEVSFSDND